MPNYNNDDELLSYKRSMPEIQYDAIISAFETLWGGYSSKNDNAQVDGIIALTEENFIKNIKNIIGHDEPYFGKMLYLWIARGYDRAKITF